MCVGGVGGGPAGVVFVVAGRNASVLLTVISSQRGVRRFLLHKNIIMCFSTSPSTYRSFILHILISARGSVRL